MVKYLVLKLVMQVNFRKIILVWLALYTILSAQTPYILTKFSSLYPLVEIYTKKVPQSYKAEITEIIKEYAKEMNISTAGYSSRPLAIIISRVAIGETLVLKVQLLLGEEVRRLDDNEEVFALTYQKEDIFEVNDLEEDLIDSVEYLLEEFKDQYIEDNEE